MNRVREYCRPASLEEALALLARPAPRSQPLAGGTYLALAGSDAEALVDLAGAGLAGIRQDGDRLTLGAMTTLQALVDAPELGSELRRAAERVSPRNIRNQATLGGAVALGGSHALLACLLALDTHLLIEPGEQLVPALEYLVRSSGGQPDGHLIVSLSFPGRRRLGWEEIARTPADKPVMCIAVGAEIVDGRLANVRVASGGGDQPLASGPEAASRLEGSPLAQAEALATDAAAAWAAPWADDVRARQGYRQSMQPVLLRRAIARLVAQG